MKEQNHTSCLRAHGKKSWECCTVLVLLLPQLMEVLWQFTVSQGQEEYGQGTGTPVDTGLLGYPFFRAVPVQSLVENK